MAEITGVAFKEGGKVYYFAPGNETYEKGKGIIVETSRGVEYATVVIPRATVDDDKIVSPLKPVIRAATPRDDETQRKNLERKEGAMQTVRERIEKFNLEMKLIDCEFTFDGAKAVFYYSAPQRVDFRELVKDLSSIFRMRIELRQVGIRDEIKMYGGIAPCGRECCCASCMPELKKVSIKMAKNQGLSLNPTKISGLCGRLMCCLAYENDYYAEACKCMPKIGSQVETPEGTGTVVNVNMLKMEVRVKIEDKEKDLFTYKDFPVDGLGCGGCGKCAPAKENSEEDDAEREPERPVPATKGERSDRPSRNKGRNRSEREPKPEGNSPRNKGERSKGEREKGEREAKSEGNHSRNKGERNKGEQGEKAKPAISLQKTAPETSATAEKSAKNRRRRRNRNKNGGAKQETRQELPE